MFGLPRWATFVIMAVLTIAVLAGVAFYVDKEQSREIPLTVQEQAAECALSKMTFKMKRAKAMAEHHYAMRTIEGKAAKYVSPSEDRTFVSLVQSCLPKGASKQDQIDAVNRLDVMLAYDDEYQRLMEPFKRVQDRAMQQRK